MFWLICQHCFPRFSWSGPSCVRLWTVKMKKILTNKRATKRWASDKTCEYFNMWVILLLASLLANDLRGRSHIIRASRVTNTIEKYMYTIGIRQTLRCMQPQISMSLITQPCTSSGCGLFVNIRTYQYNFEHLYYLFLTLPKKKTYGGSTQEIKAIICLTNWTGSAAPHTSFYVIVTQFKNNLGLHEENWPGHLIYVQVDSWCINLTGTLFSFWSRSFTFILFSFGIFVTVPALERQKIHGVLLFRSYKIRWF